MDRHTKRNRRTRTLTGKNASKEYNDSRCIEKSVFDSVQHNLRVDFPPLKINQGSKVNVATRSVFLPSMDFVTVLLTVLSFFFLEIVRWRWRSAPAALAVRILETQWNEKSFHVTDNEMKIYDGIVDIAAFAKKKKKGEKEREKNERSFLIVSLKENLSVEPIRKILSAYIGFFTRFWQRLANSLTNTIQTKRS